MMKKRLYIFSILVMLSVVAFGQIPDPSYTSKTLRGSFNFTVGTDTVKLYPEYGIRLDTLYFADDTKMYTNSTGGSDTGYVKTVGDTMSGLLKIDNDLVLVDTFKHNGLNVWRFYGTLFGGVLDSIDVAASGGLGTVYYLDEYAKFHFRAGVVTLLESTLSFKNTDTGTANDICIYMIGTDQLIIKDYVTGLINVWVEIKFY